MTKQIAGTRSLKVLDAACRHLNFTRAAAELKLVGVALSGMGTSRSGSDQVQ
jgi:hypothetical protein